MTQESRSYTGIKKLLREELGSFDSLYLAPHPGNTANPYLSRLFAEFPKGSPQAPRPLRAAEYLIPWWRRVTRKEKAVWSQHWLQFSSFPTFVRTNFRLIASILFALSGGRILWTIHNEQPHAGRFVSLNAWYCRQLARFVYRFHVHHIKARDFVMKQYGADPDRIVILKHPTYLIKSFAKDKARDELLIKYGLETRGKSVVLMFGFIAPYKGIDEVIRITGELDQKNLLLIVAGPVSEAEKSYGSSLVRSATSPRAIILNRYIPEEDVGLFFGAADAVLFNHKRGLTSGAMQLAYDYGSHILAPDIDALAAFPEGQITVFHSAEELAVLLTEIASAPDN